MDLSHQAPEKGMSLRDLTTCQTILFAICTFAGHSAENITTSSMFSFIGYGT